MDGCNVGKVIVFCRTSQSVMSTSSDAEQETMEQDMHICSRREIVINRYAITIRYHYAVRICLYGGYMLVVMYVCMLYVYGYALSPTPVTYVSPCQRLFM